MFVIFKFSVVCFVGVLFMQLHLSHAEESSSSQLRPHIIFILADDLGWNDVSFHGSPEIPTPNLDALASSGLILHNYYAETLCTPSRGALMTGKYPIRLGLQHFVIRAGEPSALPLDTTIMPQYLKRLGYSTHMVGKWHLGYMRKKFTPTFRGFDTFFGTYNGMMDYYDYTHYIKTGLPSSPEFFGIDLQNGTDTVKDFRGPYATHTFTEKAMDIIKQHDSTKPLFLYMAYTAPHTGCQYMPLQAPPHLVNRFKHIKNERRRIYAGMVSALDDSVGSIIATLHKKNMLTNSLVVFYSDNGGVNSDFASNRPLRGWKFDFWEGGVRVPSFVFSPRLRLQKPRVSTQLMHVTDWLPTIYSVAGGNVSNLGDIDGHNMWDSLVANSPSPRLELLHTINPIGNVSVLRKGHLKLVSGNQSYSSGSTGGLEDMPLPSSMDKWVYQRGSVVRDILKKIGLYLPKEPDVWRQKAGPIKCKTAVDEHKCDPLQKPCLFNITADPCENYNIAQKHPEIVRSMMHRMKYYKTVSVEPQFKNRDIHADPRCHGFAHVPWLDSEYKSDCPLATEDS